MKRSHLITVLCLCATARAAEYTDILDTIRNSRIPLEERDKTALDYAKTQVKNIPQWLPYVAAMENLTKTGLYLIDLGINPQTEYNAGWKILSEPLVYAMQNGNKELAKKIIEKSKKKPQELMALFLQNLSPSMPLFLLAPSDLDKEIQEREQKKLIGQRDILKILLDKGALPNPSDNAPLMAFLESGNYDAAKLLIEKGAPVQKIVLKQEPLFGTEPLVRATSPLLITIENSWRNPARALSMIKLLIEKGANVNTVGGIVGAKETTPLEIAINKGLEEIARLLLKKGADKKRLINLPTRAMSFNNIPLIHAASYGLMPELVSDLLQSGALAKSELPNGMNPLHLAYYKKEAAEDPTAGLPDQDKITRLKKITELLLKNGASINAQDESGNTALHYALLWENPEGIVTTLLSFKPGTMIKNRAGQTVVDSARALQKTAPDFAAKNRLAEAIMEKAGNRDWPSDEQIQTAYQAYWDKIIQQLQS